MVTISPELFRSTKHPYPGKVLLKSVPLKKLFLRVVPRELPKELELRGWFVMGEFASRRPSLIVFWTVSHPHHDHSLVLISKLTPSSSKHLLVASHENPLEGALMFLVIDAFGILSFGHSTFWGVLPTWFLPSKEPEALEYLLQALSMMFASPRRKPRKLLEKLTKFKGRPFDRVKSARNPPSPPLSAEALCRTRQSIINRLDRLYGFVGGRPDSFEIELKLLAEKPERLQRLFCAPDYVVAQLKEDAQNLERWYKLMLEPDYLSAEVRATLWLWHFLSIESQLPEQKQKLVRNNIRDLLEFLARLNFQFAKRALTRLPAA
jgi:hypothetical protein